MFVCPDAAAHNSGVRPLGVLSSSAACASSKALTTLSFPSIESLDSQAKCNAVLQGGNLPAVLTVTSDNGANDRAAQTARQLNVEHQTA